MSWFRDTGYAQLIEEIDKTEGSKPIAVIFNLGVNDLGNAGNYVSYMTSIASTLKSKNCKLLHACKPDQQYYDHKSRKRRPYRGTGKRIQQQDPFRSFSGLQVHRYVQRTYEKGYGTNARYDGVDDGDDGLHYTTKTFKRIYYYCITYLNTGSINASYY